MVSTEKTAQNMLKKRHALNVDLLTLVPIKRAALIINLPLRQPALTAVLLLVGTTRSHVQISQKISALSAEARTLNIRRAAHNIKLVRHVQNAAALLSI